MLKIQRTKEFQTRLNFQSHGGLFDEFRQRFLSSDLGKIYQAIPWDDLVKSFALKEHRKGPQCYFSPQGKIALMFLKSYADCSDQKLLEQLNSNIDYQFFCDLHLGRERLTNAKIISDIRCELADKLEMDKLQKLFYQHWSPYIEQPEKVMMDATCYQSEVRYPTDQKLLWECVDWSYQKLCAQHQSKGLKTPRTKYLKWQGRYLNYSKMKRRTRKKRVALTRSLLWLLCKLDGLLDDFEQTYPDFKFTDQYCQRRATIKTIYDQQKHHFETGESPKNRIVSIHKPYVRPIVRGKEINKVEFGAKAHKFQLDGISFLQKLSFDNFNEGILYQQTISTVQSLTGVKVTTTGADMIYATNANRNFASKNDLKTDFKPKGPRSKAYQERKKVRAEIAKERSTRLEGSFGKDKEHYGLRKVKAKTEKTEKLWIFFAIQTGNALEIGRRMVAKRPQQAA